MRWTVVASKKVEKQCDNLTERVKDALFALIKDIELNGPVRGNWQNFGYLKTQKCYHCHLRRGRPTYVALWAVDKEKIRVVEVVYVGTHEKAPY